MSPLALDPEATFDVVLESDEGKADPPTFVFRYLPSRLWRQVAHVFDKGEEAEPLDTVLARHEETLRIPLVGWRNVVDLATGRPIPYDPAALDSILTPREVSELLGSFLRESQLGPAEKKGSASQSTSNTGSSAPDATVESARGSSDATAPAMSSSAPPAADGTAAATTAGTGRGS